MNDYDTLLEILTDERSTQKDKSAATRQSKETPQGFDLASERGLAGAGPGLLAGTSYESPYE